MKLFKFVFTSAILLGTLIKVQSLYADEAKNLWMWLHTNGGTEKDTFKTPLQEDKSSIEEYRPIILF